MFEKLEIMQMAQAMASNASLRQTAVTQNIANADTPGYVARDVATFADTYESDDAAGLRKTRSGHIGADTTYSAEIRARADQSSMSPNGNAVSLEEEMVSSVNAKRQHDLALTIYKTSMGILRTSLGRT